MAYEHEIEELDIAWCPGCGNHGIRTALMQSLEELEIPASELVLVSGIGQAAKMPHYIKCSCFNGLHGRALPPATAIAVCNRDLTVIAEGGDGDMYGEGGNHFIHCIRRNPDICHLVHNNMVYGLTKGQASPTSMTGFKTPVQPEGVILRPFDPVAVAIALDASFVARSFAGDPDHLTNTIAQAIRHEGYALVDILQPCVTFNKVNDFQWFRDNTFELDEDYDPADRKAAFATAVDSEKLALGVIYRNDGIKTFQEKQPVWEESDEPLYLRRRNMDELEKLLYEYRL